MSPSAPRGGSSEHRENGLGSGSMSEYGNYVKPYGEPAAGPLPSLDLKLETVPRYALSHPIAARADGNGHASLVPGVGSAADGETLPRRI